MQITAYGSAGEVTGSNYYLTSDTGTSFLVDFGLFQGSKMIEAANRLPLEFDPAELDFVILTHGHIDHSGRLPMLTKLGFQGKIFMTYPTRDLVEALLLDSASIQLEEDMPLYTSDDVHQTLSLIYPLELDDEFTEKDITLSFHQSGHLLGSAFVKLHVEGKTITFSGDVGRYQNDYYPDPTPIGQTDILVTESTYGNSLHRSKDEAFQELLDAILTRFKQGRTIIIPAFSVGRTSEILHGLRKQARATNQEGAYNEIPIYLDSPLGISALNIYRKNQDQLSEHFREELLKGPNIHLLEEAEQSYGLDSKTHPKLIITSGGMAQGGHITHHLTAFLPQATTTIIFVGFQAEETVGRSLQDGMNPVLIADREVDVKAELLTIRGFSGHGDQGDLFRWIETGKPKKIYLSHGEPEVLTDWKAFLEAKGYPVEIIKKGETITL